MNKAILADETFSTVYLPEIGALVVSDVNKVNRPTSVLEKESTKEFISWGDANDYPQVVYELCENNSIIPSTLGWKTRTVIGSGIVYGIMKEGKFQPVENPNVDLFLDRNNIDAYLEESMSDLFWFANAYPELVLDAARSQFIAITAQEAYHTRLAKQSKNGLFESALVSALWPNAKAEEWKEIKTIDPYFDPVTRVQAGKDIRYIYPISVSSPGKQAYQKAEWHSVIFGNWLDVAQRIPEFKKALLKNQISIKYLIEVADDWWRWKYNDWDAKPELKKSRKETEFKNFQDFLSGSENSGKTLMSTFKTDHLTGKEYSAWKITAVDDKIKTGMYMEESQEASAHILFALGVDATLIGNTPGKGMGSGSGSDKKVAYNIFVLSHRAHQKKVLAPLNFIAKYNKWTQEGKQIVFQFDNYLIATQEQEATNKKL